MVLVSFVCALINGRMDETVNAALEGAKNSVEVLLSFAGIMCMWTGFLRIGENSGLCDKIAKVFEPLVKRLFRDIGDGAKRYITMNMSANLLGMGNAATPMGIKAMKELDKLNENPQKPSKNMCMLTVINTTSIQLVPSTIIALRAASGAADPSAVILPVWVASAAGFAVAVMCVKLFIRD